MSKGKLKKTHSKPRQISEVNKSKEKTKHGGEGDKD